MALRITARMPFDLGHRKLGPGEALDLANPQDVDFIRQRLRWSAFAVSFADEPGGQVVANANPISPTAHAEALARAEKAEAALAALQASQQQAVSISLPAILAARPAADLVALGLTEKQAQKVIENARAAAG